MELHPAQGPSVPSSSNQTYVFICSSGFLLLLLLLFLMLCRVTAMRIGRERVLLLVGLVFIGG